MRALNWLGFFRSMFESSKPEAPEGAWYETTDWELVRYRNKRNRKRKLTKISKWRNRAS